MYHSYDNEQNYVKRITDRGLSIYDPIDPGDPDYWIPTMTPLQKAIGPIAKHKNLI
jgi:hypothetical protein